MSKMIETLQKVHDSICKHELNLKQTAKLKNVNVVKDVPVHYDTIIASHYNSAVLTTAYNHLRNARMFIGDILLEFGAFRAYGGATKPLEATPGTPKHLVLLAEEVINWKEVVLDTYKKSLKGSPLPEGFSEGAIDSFLSKDKQELAVIGYYKKFLGDAFTHEGMFYFLCGEVQNIQEAFAIYLDEQETKIEMKERRLKAMKVYVDNLLTELSLCNKHFGLRIGELMEK